MGAFTAGTVGKDGSGKCNSKADGAGGDDRNGSDWKISPWYHFSDASTDTCVVTDAGQKCWSKTISGKTVKWCGKCFSKKYQSRGMWTSNNTHCHFTHEHVSRGPGQGQSANLATDRTPVEEPPPEEQESSSAVRPGTSFQDALQQAVEGN